MREHSLRWWTRGKARLVAFLAFAVALLMVAAVMPPAHADTSTYTSEDEFIAGTTAEQSHPAKLTVTKLLTLTQGFKATGSVQDKNSPNIPANQVAKDVPFKLTFVTPNGVTPGNMKPDQERTFTRGITYVGKTNSSGVIQNGGSGIGYWHTGSYDDTRSVASFPIGYYLLEEVTGDSSGNPYTNPSNDLFDPTYAPAEKAIFDLPYRATNTTNPSGGGAPTSTDGFVYNLHVYPKNVNYSQLSKRVVAVCQPNSVGGGTGYCSGTGPERPGKVAQDGDDVIWEITQKLYDGNSDPAGALNNDSKLDLSEIRAVTNTATTVLKIADRFPRNVALDSGYGSGRGVTRTLSWKENGVQHAAVNDTSTAALNSMSNAGNVARIGGAAGSMFPSFVMSPNYIAVEWKGGSNNALGTLAGNYRPGVTYTDIKLTLTVRTTMLYGSGDSTNDSPLGWDSNIAASDNIDNLRAGTKSFKAVASLATPSVQFVKTNKRDDTHPLKGVSGAVFYLIKHDGDKTKFLYNNRSGISGTAPGSQKYISMSEVDEVRIEKQKIVQGTSNSKGIVTFTGIPIIDPSTGKVYDDTSKLKFDMVEYEKPKYNNPANPSGPMLDYQAPSIAYQTIDFSQYAGKSTVELEAAGLGVPADMSKLNFKDYKTPNMPTGPTSPFTNLKGDPVTLGVMNWQQDQTDPAKVGALPLTGGRGILLMLIVGLIVMLIGLLVSKRHERRMARGAHRA
ncbi:isopeptide-forming domain-containing protein [Bifidobacterium xylocopae]|uniref:Gram-positive cocci surface proteins LPxTG domain-containing protein n=1 Tax=Bifidobacterium xylocopae TaxID=2493119 RepID=A0A366KCZ3_9BIFI|nr:LPXTG cell wall anchor domain-containing protein [Bifidobacterium xylocopae]RBP99606.1 hypothetical protein CRD59_02385 [Bifidobacterium xylocopae]